mgnify:FL=1
MSRGRKARQKTKEMNIKTVEIENLYKEGLPFGDLLPYFVHEEGVFALKDGSIGQIWEFNLVETEVKNPQYLEQLSNNIEGLLTRIPENTISCQFILIADEDFSDKINAYTNVPKIDNEIVKLCMQEKIRHLFTGREGFFQQHTGVYCLKRIRAFFTMRYFPPWSHPGFNDKLLCYFTGENVIKKKLSEEFQKNRQEFERICDTVEGVFKGCEITFRRLEEDGLFRILYKLLNPKRSKMLPIPTYRENEYLTDQILYNYPKAKYGGFEFEDNLVKVVTLKELPLETETGMFTAEVVRGTRFSMLDMIKNFMLVINFYVPAQDDATRRVKMQKAFAFMQRSTMMGDKSVEAEEKREEFDSVIKETFTSGHKIIYPRIHFIVNDDDPDKVKRNVNNILNALNRMGCEGLEEEIIGASLFLSCLPLCYDHYYEKLIKRTKRIVSHNLADMLPVYGSMAGTRTPAAIYLNRRGEPVFMDLQDSNTNSHCLLIGSSGAGKSFMINDLCLQAARLDAHFFVLDKGDSYKKLCQVLGGQYITFELNNPVTINPFLHKPDAEHLAFLITVLATMCSGTDERDRLTREQEGVLQKAILAAYEDNKDIYKEITLSDVVEQLNRDSCNSVLGLGENIGKTLALKLSSFTKEGQYAKFFDGKNTFNLNAKFTVFELGNLSAHKDLQLVVLLNIMYFITDFVSLPEMRPKRKYLLIDEAWSLLKVKDTAEFIETSFKTYRKYGCSVVAITQEVADLVGTKSGQAIQANSSNKIYLKQDPQAVESLKSFAGLTDKEAETLRSVVTVKGKYSEALVLTDSSRGVIRLVPNPFLYWIATSDAKDNGYLASKLREHNGKFVDAIEACIKEYPYGLH